ncbi:MAG: hypothetical protein GQ561_01485 [Calditrichae bacterium]|nr:hypothetical protein [Calditrichia bacterium]
MYFAELLHTFLNITINYLSYLETSEKLRIHSFHKEIASSFILLSSRDILSLSLRALAPVWYGVALLAARLASDRQAGRQETKNLQVLQK